MIWEENPEKSIRNGSLRNKFHKVAGSRPQMGHNVPLLHHLGLSRCPPPPSTPLGFCCCWMECFHSVSKWRHYNKTIFSANTKQRRRYAGTSPLPNNSLSAPRKKISSHFVTPPLPHLPFVKRPKKRGEKNRKVKQEGKKKKTLAGFFLSLFSAPSLFSQSPNRVEWVGGRWRRRWRWRK